MGQRINQESGEHYREWGEQVKPYAHPDLVLTHGQGFAPCIYVWKRQGEVLYVGMSRYGLGRPFGGGHLRVRGLQAEDVVEVFLCPTATEAQLRIHEREFVEQFRPRFNRMLQVKRAGRKPPIGDRKRSERVRRAAWTRQARRASKRPVG